MTDVLLPQVLEVIRATQGAYHKLPVLAGPTGSGKTRLLNQVPHWTSSRAASRR
jgi:hypothetical protein